MLVAVVVVEGVDALERIASVWSIDSVLMACEAAAVVDALDEASSFESMMVGWTISTPSICIRLL